MDVGDTVTTFFFFLQGEWSCLQIKIGVVTTYDPDHCVCICMYVTRRCVQKANLWVANMILLPKQTKEKIVIVVVIQ